ncbi:MAG TPA: hypothetical protein VD790_04515 [Thermoleophilaceae bacterium]|nr:hypothetical protein [Thermoleophilaceae bacterium]
MRASTIVGSALAVLILALFAYLIVDAQSQDREDAEQSFQDVAQVSAAVTNGIFQSAFESTGMQAAEEFAGPVEQEALAQFAAEGQSRYVAVYDEQRRRLGATSGAPPPGPAVDIALESGKPRLSDVMGKGAEATIEFAIPYETPTGRRIFVTGSPTQPFAEFLAASLGELPTVADAETLMLDSNGVVLGGDNLSVPVGERIEDEDLIAALGEADSGDYGEDRYYAAGEITNTPFRIVLDVAKDDLYAETPGRSVSWILLIAFAAAVLAGLYLLRRFSLAATELQRRELNERHAVEINDNIIQGLALAKYQLQMGEKEASATQVSETLREAQRLVSGLLGEAEVQAGQLRREVAAETSRPDEPPPGAKP